MQAVLAAILSLLFLDPLQATISSSLGAAGIPQAAAEKVVACARSEAPAILRRIGDEPVRTAVQIVNFWIGSAKAEVVLAEIAPKCAGTIDAARQFGGRRA